MNKFSVALLAASALSVSATAVAEDWYVAPAVGFVIADIDDFDLGPSVYLSAGKELLDNWNVEFSTAYSALDVKNNGKYRRSALNVSGVYFPNGRDGDFAPFALASIGGSSVDLSLIHI